MTTGCVTEQKRRVSAWTEGIGEPEMAGFTGLTKMTTAVVVLNEG